MSSEKRLPNKSKMKSKVAENIRWTFQVAGIWKPNAEISSIGIEEIKYTEPK